MMDALTEDDWIAAASKNGFALLLKDTQGAVFEHQAGGYACRHPSTCGRFSDQFEISEADETAIFDLTETCHCITASLADKLDQILRSYALHCDPAFLGEGIKDGSQEAWIHVIHADSGPAVLVYPNSD